MANRVSGRHRCGPIPRRFLPVVGGLLPGLQRCGLGTSEFRVWGSAADAVARKRVRRNRPHEVRRPKLYPRNCGMRTPGAKRQQNGVTAGETALHFSSLRRASGSDVGRVFYTHPQAMTAEGAGVLRRMGASARRSGAREYRLSHKSPLALVAGAEKCPATLRNPACVRPVHGMANKVEVLGLAARRRGLSIHSSPARRTSGLVGSHGSAGNSRPSRSCSSSRASRAPHSFAAIAAAACCRVPGSALPGERRSAACARVDQCRAAAGRACDCAACAARCRMTASELLSIARTPAFGDESLRAQTVAQGGEG